MKNDSKTIVEEIEKELFSEILNSMKMGKLSRKQAAVIAKDYLKLLPFLNKEDISEKLYEISKIHDEIKPVYARIISPLEEEKRKLALDKMRNIVRVGLYDAVNSKGGA